MIRYGVVPIHEVLPHVLYEHRIPGSDYLGQRREYLGESVSMASHRLQTFSCHGIKCVGCNLEGQFFAIERYPQDVSYHLNLYSLDIDGKEILMTKDHIIPRSKGGKDVLTNYQTMCSPCNIQKGSKVNIQGIT